MNKLLLAVSLGLLSSVTLASGEIHPTVIATGGYTTANSYICSLNTVGDHPTNKGKYMIHRNDDVGNLQLTFKARARHGDAGAVRGFLEYSRNGEKFKTVYGNQYDKDLMVDWDNDGGFAIITTKDKDQDEISGFSYDRLDQEGQVINNGKVKYHISHCKVIKKQVPKVENKY